MSHMTDNYNYVFKRGDLIDDIWEFGPACNFKFAFTRWNLLILTYGSLTSIISFLGEINILVNLAACYFCNAFAGYSLSFHHV